MHTMLQKFKNLVENLEYFIITYYTNKHKYVIKIHSILCCFFCANFSFVVRCNFTHDETHCYIKIHVIWAVKVKD